MIAGANTTISRKAIIGWARTTLLLGSVLFLAAGSFRYWQAWVFLALFATCTGGLTLHLVLCNRELLARRINVGATAERQNFQKRIQSIAGLLVFVSAILPGLDHRFHWSAIPSRVSWAANVISALGFAIIFLVFRENRFTSATVEVAPGQTVTTTGPYRFVRHPMYAGSTLVYLFAPLALGSWITLPCTAAVVVTMAIRAVDEERFLAANLPGYRQYCQRVRFRFAPGVW